MNANTSATSTSGGRFPTTEKKTYRSNCRASNVFGRTRAAANLR